MLRRDTSKRNVLPSEGNTNPAVKREAEFTQEKFNEARRIFAKYDTEGEGSITVDQLYTILKDCGHDEANAKELVANMNLADGRMTFSEFVTNLPIIEQQKFNSISEILSSSMKKKVTDERMLRARYLFSKYDLDGSGSIDRDELNKIFEEIGQTPSEELLQRLDPDGSGNITFMEFVNAYDIWNEILVDDSNAKNNTQYKGSKVKLSQQQMAAARATFSKYDTDGDGQVSSTELFSILKKLLMNLHNEYEAEKEAKDLMAIIDADGDGHITFIEFVKGYEFWVQVEEANLVREKLEEEINEMQSSIKEIGSKRRETTRSCNRLSEDLDKLKAQLQAESDERMKIEKEILAALGEQEGKLPEEHFRIQGELRDMYDMLSDMSLLLSKSRDFYCKMQLYISTNHVKKSSVNSVSH